MSSMFAWCISLSYLPDISKWDISKVTDLSYMFQRCFSLSSISYFSYLDNDDYENEIDCKYINKYSINSINNF